MRNGRNGRQVGNTLAEYALLLSLVVIASLTGVALFGNTLFHFQGDVASHIATTLPFGVKSGQQGNSAFGAVGGWFGQGDSDATGTTSEKSLAATGGWAQTGADGSDTPMAGPDVQQVSGGSSNMTSSDGDGASVDNLYAATIAAAIKMQEMAASTTLASLKAWFENAAQNTMRLAKNQAALAYNLDASLKDNSDLLSFVGQSDISQATAMNSMDAWQKSLEEQRANLLNNAELGNTAVAQAGLAMVDSVLQANSSQYGDSLSQDNSWAGVYNPSTNNLKQDALNAINAGLAPDSWALQSSLKNAVSLQSTADSLP
jgi:hypothetical protein